MRTLPFALATALACIVPPATAVQTPTQPPAASAPTAAPGPLAPLSFLLGRWSAHTTAGPSAPAANGTYTFALDLGGHAIQRTSTSSACTGPRAFDCNHRDQLTLFADANAQAAHGASLLAFYLDNEGHTIYYVITTPDPNTAIFDSQAPAAAPHFRLTYHREGQTLSGKFQMAPPNSTTYTSYLEWTGTAL